MTSNLAVCGNLALQTSAAVSPSLLVVDGGLETLSGTNPQLCPADVSAHPSARPTSLYRILVFSMLALMLVIACGSSFFAYASARSARQEAFISQLTSVSVCVAPGDSLWSIASDYPVEGLPVQQAVELMREWNALDSSTLQAGTFLEIPTRAS